MGITLGGIWLIVFAALAAQQFALKRTGARVTWASYLVAAAWPLMVIIMIIIFTRTYVQTLRGKI